MRGINTVKLHEVAGRSVRLDVAGRFIKNVVSQTVKEIIHPKSNITTRQERSDTPEGVQVSGIDEKGVASINFSGPSGRTRPVHRQFVGAVDTEALSGRITEEDVDVPPLSDRAQDQHDRGLRELMNAQYQSPPRR